MARLKRFLVMALFGTRNPTNITRHHMHQQYSYRLTDTDQWHLNLDDDFVPFLSFFHLFPKWKGRKYFFHNAKKKLVITIHGRNTPTLICIITKLHKNI